MSEPVTVAEYAPPDCAICSRSLLVGEAVQLFRDRDSRLVKVCELCRTNALGRGFESLGVDAQRMRVQATGAVNTESKANRDDIIAGLGNELAYLQQQLGEAQAALVDQSLQGDALHAITDKLRRQERELERLRREADPAQRARDQRTIADLNQQVAQLRAQMRQRDEQLARLELARRSEVDSTTMCRYALDAFNSSEHCERMSRIARTLGEPEVSVFDQGPGIPRGVLVTLVWEIAWYEFSVKLDLGTGRASVKQTGNGGNPDDLPTAQRHATAKWRTSGPVLA